MAKEVIEKLLSLKVEGTDAIQKLREEIEKLTKAIEGLKKGSKEYEDAINQLKNAQKQYEEALKQAELSTSAAEGSYKSLTQQLSKLRQEWMNAGTDAERADIDRQIGEINSQLSQMRKENANAAKGLKEGKNNADAAAGSYNALNAQLKQLTNQWKNAGTEAERADLGRQISEIKSQMKEMSSSTKEANESVRETTDTAEAAAGSYNALSKELSALRKEWKSLGDDSADRRDELAKEMASIQDRLKEFDASVGVYNRNVGNYANSIREVLGDVLSNLGDISPVLAGLGQRLNSTGKLASKVGQLATKSITGVKKALVSTGIGAIVVAVGMLIAYWREFAAAIGISQEQIDSFKDGATKVLKSVISYIVGAGNVVYQFLINPFVKLTQLLFDFGKAAKEALSFNWEGLEKVREETKQTLNELGDAFRNTINFRKNFQDGAKAGSEMIDVIGMRLKSLNKEENDNIKSTVSNAKTSFQSLYEFRKSLIDRLLKYRQDNRGYDERISDTDTQYESDRKALQESQKAYEKQLQARYNGQKAAADKNNKELSELQAKYNDASTNALKKELQKQIDELKNGYVNMQKAQREYQEELLKSREEYNEAMATLDEEWLSRRGELLVERDNDDKAEIEKATKEQLAALENSLTILQREARKRRFDADYSTYAGTTEEQARQRAEAINKINLDMYEKEIELIRQALEAFTGAEEGKIELEDRLQEAIEKRAETMRNADNLSSGTTSSPSTLTDNATSSILSLAKEYKEAYSEMSKSDADWFTSFNYYFGQANGTMSAFADAYESMIQRQVASGKMSEKEAEKQFKKVKAIRIAEAITESIGGGIATFMGYQKSGIPQPYATILGLAGMASNIAAGMAQVEQIRQTSIGNNSAANTTVANAVPSIVESAPTYVTNTTGLEDNTQLANALMNTQIVVKVSDIEAVQNRGNERDVETTW